MSEQGDAGDLPSTAQNLGSGAVSSIFGSFTGGADVDVYRVCLTDGASFSASTVGFTTLDTQLFLFDSQGFGVYSNDDAALGVHASRLPAGHRFSPSESGEYFLAVSSFNNDPHSPAGEIFPDLFSASLYPDGVVDAAGVGAEEPIVSWSGPTRGPHGLYRINVTGTTGCDTTPPTVDLRSPADGADVRQGAELVVDFSCSDEGGSGIASCVGTVADGELLDTSKLGEVSVTVTARDQAGNETVVKSTVTVVDDTEPTITLTTPSDGAVYELGEQVLADYSCADEPNGSGLDSCEGSVASGAAVDTGSLGEKTFTVNASDEAGNTHSKSVSYTVVDTRAPTISITSPVDGAVYSLGERVLADYACEDQAGGSGVAGCDGTVTDGEAIDTSSTGTHSFEVRATDAAGNSAATTVIYNVAYDFDGFRWPVQNPPHVNVWKAGVPVLIRFSLGGYKDAHPEAPGYPRSTRCGGGGVEQARGAFKRRGFRYDRRRDQYVLLWKTDRKWVGNCREFLLRLDDGSLHTAQFQFVKR